MTSPKRKLWPFCQLVLLKFSVFNQKKKQTALILKCIDQLPQNLARVHNLEYSFDTNHENFKLFCFSNCFHCILLFFYCSFCSNIDDLSEVEAAH